MIKILVKTAALLVVGMLFAGPVAAQDTDIDALIQQYLPANVTLAEATTGQIEEAISESVSANPQASLRIVARATRQRPDMAPDIASAAVAAAPYYSDAIVNEIIQVVPDQAVAVRDAVARTHEDRRQAAAENALGRSPEHEDRAETAPPIRDDASPSPVNP